MKFVVCRLVAPIINTNRGAPPCWSQGDREATGSEAGAGSAAVSPATPLVTPYVVMAGGGAKGLEGAQEATTAEGGKAEQVSIKTGRCNAFV
jgi:hypothetical protein